MTDPAAALDRIAATGTPHAALALADALRDTTGAEPAQAAAWLAVLRGLGPPRRYRQTTPWPGAILSDRPWRPARCLVVALAGRLGRVSMPLPVVLQHLPPDADCLLLTDPDHLHYRSGPGRLSLAAPAVAALAARVPFALALGTSSGGFPALRLARMAGLPRGVAVAGRRIDDSLRLLRGTPPPPAYDPLCPCGGGGATSLLALHGARHPQDAADAAWLAASTGAAVATIPGTGRHDLLWAWAEAAQLRHVLALICNETEGPKALTEALVRLPPPAPWQGRLA